MDINRPKRSSTKTLGKLQLWTNQSKTKYAIGFENESSYLAKTDPELPQYTTLIAESDTMFRGYEYDWKYILINGLIITSLLQVSRRDQNSSFSP
jgi:hypothetical protein